MMDLARTTDYFAFLDMHPTQPVMALRQHFGIPAGLAIEAAEAWERTYEPETTAEERARIYHLVRVRS